jgi:hypothetical protein
MCLLECLQMEFNLHTLTLTGFTIPFYHAEQRRQARSFRRGLFELRGKLCFV